MSIERSWTDELCRLFVAGELPATSARDVRRAIDWIQSQPSLVERIDRARARERRDLLVDLVSTWCDRRAPTEPGGEGQPDPSRA